MKKERERERKMIIFIFMFHIGSLCLCVCVFSIKFKCHLFAWIIYQKTATTTTFVYGISFIILKFLFLTNKISSYCLFFEIYDSNSSLSSFMDIGQPTTITVYFFHILLISHHHFCVVWFFLIFAFVFFCLFL